MVRNATRAVLSAALSLLSVSAQAGDGAPAACMISGTVTDSRTGAPVPGATVEIAALGSDQHEFRRSGSAPLNRIPPARPSHRTESDARGAFRFDSLPTGRYVLTAKKTGFLDSPYGAARPSQLSAIVRCGDGEPVEANLRLIAQGVITGRVVNERGEAVEAGVVQALSRVWVNGKPRYTLVRGARPNDLGEYRLAGLPPGTYFVRFQPSGSSAVMSGEALAGAAPVPTYHPFAAALIEATAVPVRAGERAAGKDITVREARTYSISGVLRAAGRAPEFASLTLLPEGEEPTALLVGNNMLGPEGTFRLTNVPSGDYHLMYLAGTDQGISSGRVDVRVADEDVKDLLIEAPPPVSVEGVVRIEDSESGASVPVSETKILITAADVLIGPSYSAEVADDGRFVLEACSPGRYLAEIEPPRGMYVSSVRYGGSDVAGRPFTITGGGAIHITLRRGSAQLTGTIVPPKDSGSATPVSAGGAYFLLIGRRGDGSPSVERFGYSDSRGTFTLTGLAPGRYHVLALASPDPKAFEAPAVVAALARLGTEVELTENDRLAVTVALVGAEEAERAFGRAN